MCCNASSIREAVDCCFHLMTDKFKHKPCLAASSEKNYFYFSLIVCFFSVCLFVYLFVCRIISILVWLFFVVVFSFCLFVGFFCICMKRRNASAAHVLVRFRLFRPPLGRHCTKSGLLFLKSSESTLSVSFSFPVDFFIPSALWSRSLSVSTPTRLSLYKKVCCWLIFQRKSRLFINIMKTSGIFSTHEEPLSSKWPKTDSCWYSMSTDSYTWQNK